MRTEHKSKVENKKSGPEVAQSGTESSLGHSERRGKLSKNHQDYWKSRLVKRSYSWDGRSVEVPEWQVRISHLGRREWFNTQTTNAAAAAVKARDIHVTLISKGWEATIEKWKPGMLVSSQRPTIGEFLDAVKIALAAEVRAATFEIYARKFRTLAAGAFGIRGGAEKHDYVGPGYRNWLDRVNKIRLDRLTPVRVERWKSKYLSAVKDNPAELRRASTTVHSILRSSMSLFSPKKVLPKLKHIQLPRPLPFDGVSLPKKGQNRYRSEIDPQTLLMRAKRELEVSEPDQFKILLLALGAGLRRDEIDTLTWKQLDFSASRIHVETNEHTTAKSSESEAAVDVDPGLMEIFKEFKAVSRSKFVIDSEVAPRPQAHSYHHYRCDRTFKGLIGWLQSQGIAARNPIHALRKEFGSQICAQAGIFAASSALRHGSITLTRDHYIDVKKATVFSVSPMLANEEQPAAVGKAE